jgi:hypothetical protein
MERRCCVSHMLRDDSQVVIADADGKIPERRLDRQLGMRERIGEADDAEGCHRIAVV